MIRTIRSLIAIAAAMLLGHSNQGCIPPTKWAHDLEAAYNTALTECLNYQTQAERNACRVKVNTDFGLCTPPLYPELQLCGEEPNAPNYQDNPIPGPGVGSGPPGHGLN